LTKAKRIAAAIVPDTEADAPIIGATACFLFSYAYRSPQVSLNPVASSEQKRTATL
jgi:hypothetical protein